MQIILHVIVWSLVYASTNRCILLNLSEKALNYSSLRIVASLRTQDEDVTRNSAEDRRSLLSASVLLLQEFKSTQCQEAS